MTDRAWFDAAKGDIPQWAASMPKDADGTTIDWDWVRSLDLAHGVGTIPESTPQSIHDALKADYATREHLESIIAQCNSTFMTDYDRFIGSYRLPRALAYANRRLNDNINTLLHLGEQQHLWVVSRERRGRTTVAVLRPYSGSRPSNDDQGMLNLSGETGDASAGNTAAENSDVKFPTTVALDDIQDRTAAILDARAERRKAQRFQKRAGDAAMARANLSGATSPGGAALPGGAAASGNAIGHHPKPDWRDAYLPGRDVDAVMGIDIETTGRAPERGYIINVGWEIMELTSDAVPHDAEAHYCGLPDIYRGEDVPLSNIHHITWDDIDGKTPFRENKGLQKQLLKLMKKYPYMAHNAAFEDSWFKIHLDGYAEARRAGKIIVIDSRQICRSLDADVRSLPRESAPAALENWARRRGTLAADANEQHLGLDDTDLMLRTVQAEFNLKNLFAK